MSFQILMFLVCASIPVIICFVMRNETKPKKNIVLGATIPYLHLDDEKVIQEVKLFKKRLLVDCAVLVALLLALSFVPRMSVLTLLACVWLLPAVILPMAEYGRANARLRSLKKAEGWSIPTAGCVVVDTKAAEISRKPLSWAWFIPAMLVSGAAFIHSFRFTEAGAGLQITTGALFFTCGFSLVCYPLVFRQRADALGADTRQNAALTNVRRLAWGRIWLATAYLTAVYSAILLFSWRSSAYFIYSTLIYALLLCAICLLCEFSVRRSQEIISEKQSGDARVDEDEYWVFGQFYCNRHDSRLMVNERVGSGMSVNYARPAGKVILWLSVLVLLALPLISLWLVVSDFTPREARIENGAVTVEHVTYRIEAELDEISSAELIYELPDCVRTAGTGLDSLLEGGFSVSGYGKSSLCLDPRHSPFIVLVTPERCFIFNLATADATAELFNMIRSEMYAQN